MIATRIPNVYEELVSSNKAVPVTLTMDTLKGDTFLTESGRLYKVAFSRYPLDLEESKTIKLVELDPTDGRGLENKREETTEYFKDDFTNVVLVSNFNESVFQRESELKRSDFLIRTARHQKNQKAKELEDIKLHLIQNMPEAFEKMSIGKRMNPFNRAELAARAKSRNSLADQVQQLASGDAKEIEINKIELMNKKQYELLEQIKLRKLPSITRMQG